MAILIETYTWFNVMSGRRKFTILRAATKKLDPWPTGKTEAGLGVEDEAEGENRTEAQK